MKGTVIPAEKRRPARSTILVQLGVYGLHEVEDAVLAGLVTGDPILLVGAHGSAKTLLAERLARALALRFHAYDASKALYEDLIGFPDPASLAEGSVRYARTPLSIFDKEFVLVGEISRAAPSMQNKWLEVIRSRRIMGCEIDSLRHVVAAMNPPGDYSGAIPLDLALAGRFAFVIPMPEAADMDAEDLRLILGARGEDDARLLGGAPARHSVDLAGFLERARRRYADLDLELGAMILEWVLNAVTMLKAGRLRIDGRRAGMIVRNAVALLAVREEKGELYGHGPDALRKSLWDAFRFSMPFAATAEKVSEGVLLSAHGVAMKMLQEGKDRREADARLRVLAPSDPIKMAAVYPEVADLLAQNDHQGVITRLDEGLRPDRTPTEIARHFLALRRVLRAYQSGRVVPPADVALRAMRLYRETLAIDFGRIGRQEAILRELVNRPAEAVVLRLAARHALGEAKRGGPRAPAWIPRAAQFDEDLLDRIASAAVAIREEFERVRQSDEVWRVA